MTPQPQYAVDDPRLAAGTGKAASQTRRCAPPTGGSVDLPAAAATFDDAERPGIYRLTLRDRETAAGGEPRRRREPHGAAGRSEELEQSGAKLGTKPASDELASRQRQLQVLELENRQKLWRWLIVVVIGLLAAETALAGAAWRAAPSGSNREPHRWSHERRIRQELDQGQLPLPPGAAPAPLGCLLAGAAAAGVAVLARARVPATPCPASSSCCCSSCSCWCCR